MVFYIETKTDNFQLLLCIGSYGTLAIVHFLFIMPSIHIYHSVTVPFTKKAFMEKKLINTLYFMSMLQFVKDNDVQAFLNLSRNAKV